MRELLVVWLLCGMCGAEDTGEKVVNKRPPRIGVPKTLGTFSTRPHYFHLRNYRCVTKHPLFDYTKDHSAYADSFTDPEWYRQWYAQDYRTVDMPVMDLNLVPVYRTGNYGKGVTIGIVSDGVDPDHPDYRNNYNNAISYDACTQTTGAKPKVMTDNYGTLAAGVIAMQANDTSCGVGVAPEAKITGIRGVCSKSSDTIAGPSLDNKKNKIDIYCSVFSGKYFKKHSKETEEDINSGLLNGRKMKGTIYVFPAGSNGLVGEQCAGSSLLNHPGVIGVNGASQGGKVLSYGENCAAIFATAYAADNNGLDGGILSTTQTHGSCANGPLGTWSASAFVAGIIALVLKERPELTYRDIMHLITMTAEVAPLVDNKKTWQKNTMGFWFSLDFGFGLINAENMVNMVKDGWELVPPLQTCQKDMKDDLSLPDKFYRKKEFGFEMQCQVRYLEQIVITVTVKHNYRGALYMTLISPQGTQTVLLDSMLEDKYEQGLQTWSFKSLHAWGEDPVGKWTLTIISHFTKDRWFGSENIVLNSMVVTLLGSEEVPNHYLLGKRSYTGFRNRYCVSSAPFIDKEMNQMLGIWSTKPNSRSLLLYKGVTEHPVYSVFLKSAYDEMFNDLRWYQQWWMLDYRMDDLPVMDLNVVPVYSMKHTGKGVYIAVLADGVFSQNLDLTTNYVESLSLNTCKMATGATPAREDNKIGTLSAGLIAMEANNKLCGVGIAHNAKVAGIVMGCPGEDRLDHQEAIGLNYKLTDFDIYNYARSGRPLEPLSIITASALENGIKLGRAMRGAIYVLPVVDTDGSHSCAGQGLLNHHGVIVVNGASQSGKVLTYGSRCAAVMATAYSVDETGGEIISTYDSEHCDAGPEGTFTAAAFASGIIALVLEANPQLTYRDVMHLITLSAEVAPLADNPKKIWHQNRLRYWISRDFGFGLLNAQNMLDLAKDWVNVPPLHICKRKMLIRKQVINLTELKNYQRFRIRGCQGTEDAVFFTEQVEITVTVIHPFGANFKMTLMAPTGTAVEIWDPHNPKKATKGLVNTTIKSVHTWGEDPAGFWALSFEAGNNWDGKSDVGSKVYLNELTITVYGTEERPVYWEDKVPRTYTGFRLRDETGFTYQSSESDDDMEEVMRDLDKELQYTWIDRQRGYLESDEDK